MATTWTIRRAAAVAVALALAGPFGAAACDVSDDGDGGGELVPLALCALGEGSLAELWSVDNGHGAVAALALAGPGDVALSSEDGSIKVWSVEASGGTLGAVPLFAGGVSGAYGQQFGAGAVVRALRFDPTGASILAGDDSGLLALHDAADGGVLASTVPGLDPVTAVGMSDDGALVASADASFAGNLRLWTPGGPAEGPLATDLWSAHALAFLPGTHDLLTAGEWYGLPTVELRLGGDLATPVATWKDWSVSDVGFAVRALALPPDGTRLVAVAGNGAAGTVASIALADLGADPAPASVALPDHAPVAVVLLPGDEVFVTAGAEGTLRFFATQGADELLRVDVPAPSGLAVDPSGRLLVTAGSDGVLRLYGCSI